MIVDSEKKSLLQYLLFCEFPKYLLLDFIVAQFSLILIGTGASLMGFYRLQMLEVLNLYFIFVKDFSSHLGTNLLQRDIVECL